MDFLIELLLASLKTQKHQTLFRRIKCLKKTLSTFVNHFNHEKSKRLLLRDILKK